MRPSSTPQSFASRLFGHDVFISFALGGPPRGSQSYASDLARRLRERDLSVFFSEDEAPPGSPLAGTLMRALRRSKLLLVVVNRGTLEAPRWVRTEVETFRAECPGRPVIPVCLDNSLRDEALSNAVQPWLQHTANIWVDEEPGAAERGLATDGLVARLLTAPARLRANARWRALIGAVGLLMAVLTALAVWQAVVATRERDRAVSRQLAAQSSASLVRDPMMALLLAAQSHAVVATAESDSALLGALAALPITRLQQHDAGFAAMAIRPGSNVIFASDRRNAVWQGDAGSATLTTIVPAPQTWSLYRSVKAFAFAPDGQTWAHAGSSREITVRRGAVVRTMPDGDKIGESTVIHVLGLAFSPDGRVLASASSAGSLRLHDLASGQSRWIGTTNTPLASVVFGGGGRWVAVGGDGGFLQAFAVGPAASAPKLGGSRNGTVHSLTLDEQGRYLFAASLGGRIEVLDTNDGRLIASNDALEHGALETMAVSPDGRFLATGHSNGTVMLWQWDQTAIRPLHALLRHAAKVQGLGFAADGRTLVSAGDDGRLLVSLPVDRGRWQPQTGPGPVKDSIAPFVPAEARSADGRWIAWAGTVSAKASPFEVDMSGLSLTRVPRLTVLRGTDRSVVADGAELPAAPGERITGEPVFATGAAPMAIPIGDRRLSPSALPVGDRLLFWDLESARPLDAALPLPPNARLVGASTNGAWWLAGTDANSSVHFSFPADRAAWLDMVCALAGRRLTGEERRRHVGEERRVRPACG